MLSLKWTQRTNPSHLNTKENTSSLFGLDVTRYQMQTNMIGRVLNGYVCTGCKK